MNRSTGEDTALVERVVIGVVHAIDGKRWQELRELFADTVETDYTSLFGGAVAQQSGDALIRGWQDLLSPIVTQHLLGPVVSDIDGSSAGARCHVRGYHYRKGTPGGDEWMVAGHYVFGLEKSTGQWKIRRMKLEAFYQTGNLKLLQRAAE